MTTNDLLSGLPTRSGHFLLESGYHTDSWVALGKLFFDPAAIAPSISSLANKLRAYTPAVVCGPLLGGALVAQSIATALGSHFCYTEPKGDSRGGELFRATYELPPELSTSVVDQTIAVVDDVISAGSSVRATVAALASAGATTVVVGSLAVFGEEASQHFATQGIPLETLQRRSLNLWQADECPLCRSGMPLVDPR